MWILRAPKACLRHLVVPFQAISLLLHRNQLDLLCLQLVLQRNITTTLRKGPPYFRTQENKLLIFYFYSIIVSFKYSVETHIVWKHIYAQCKCTWNHWPWILQLHHKPIQPYPPRLVSLQFFIDLRQFLALHKRTSAVSWGPTGDREDGESADTTTITTFNSRSIGTGISNLTKARNICILFDSTSI